MVKPTPRFILEKRLVQRETPLGICAQWVEGRLGQAQEASGPSWSTMHTLALLTAQLRPESTLQREGSQTQALQAPRPPGPEAEHGRHSPCPAGSTWPGSFV